MQFSLLSSGSKANSTFIEAGSQKILIDCGLSCKQTGIRLHSLGIDPEKIDAIIVTHEHGDHIRGISVMSRKYKIPVYANEETLEFIENVYATETFTTGVPFELGNAKINPFSVVHDAVDPVGFTVEAEGLKFGQATDLGRVTPLVKEMLKKSNAIVLESNHDLNMLQTSDYPWELIQRISSNHGHISNETAGSLLFELLHDELFYVALAHLSENSNTPALALSTVNRYLKDIPLEIPFELLCGNVKECLPLFRVGDETMKVASVG